MTKYVHETHTVLCLREWSLKHSGICIVWKTGTRMSAYDRWNHKNWRFNVTKCRPCWHWMIRFPFFQFIRDNCGFEVGTPNLFLWKIS